LWKKFQWNVFFPWIQPHSFQPNTIFRYISISMFVMNLVNWLESHNDDIPAFKGLMMWWFLRIGDIPCFSVLIISETFYDDEMTRKY
jgi:hypothetical protein